MWHLDVKANQLEDTRGLPVSGELSKQPRPESPEVNLHRSARRTPLSRKQLVDRIEGGEPVRAAAEAVGVVPPYSMVSGSR